MNKVELRFEPGGPIRFWIETDKLSRKPDDGGRCWVTCGDFFNEKQAKKWAQEWAAKSLVEHGGSQAFLVRDDSGAVVAKYDAEGNELDVKSED